MKKLIVLMGVLAMAIMVGRVFAEDMGGMKMDKIEAAAKSVKGVVAMSIMLARVLEEDSVGMKMYKKEAAAKSMKCEVVDVACYTKEGAMGEKHKECAVKCISGGGELALLSKGKLYVPGREFS